MEFTRVSKIEKKYFGILVDRHQSNKSLLINKKMLNWLKMTCLLKKILL